MAVLIRIARSGVCSPPDATQILASRLLIAVVATLVHELLDEVQVGHDRPVRSIPVAREIRFVTRYPRTALKQTRRRDSGHDLSGHRIGHASNTDRIFDH